MLLTTCIPWVAIKTMPRTDGVTADALPLVELVELVEAIPVIS